MTTEEKVKAYDEALERAKDCLKDGTITSTAIDYICTIFPELGESEDERIRKTIIRFFKDQYSNETEMYDGSVTVGKAIAWLEKQGEQKPILDFKASNWYVSKVDGKIHDMTYNPTDKKELKKLTQSVTKISEQEPQSYKDAERASLEYRQMREECGIKDPVMLDEIEEAYYNGATSIQKPAWSDEDEENLQNCCGAIAAADYYTYDDKQEMEAWLQSLKGRVQPQPKIEWSEEDSKRIDQVCDFIWKNRRGDTDEIYQQEQYVKWLKSLKDRLKEECL